jgi:hypothetical protein
MQNEWFECKLEYDKMMENGTMKRVRGESYLTTAISCSEAEARMVQEMKSYISGEFMVTDIKRVKYGEMFFTEEDAADRYFKIKLIFITLDEKSGAEKKTRQDVLVQASDLHDAVQKLDEGMKGSMMDFTIASVSEAPYFDVFR